MNIDVSKIENFDSMSAEEKVDAMMNYQFDDFSDEAKRLKSANDKLSKENAEWKRQVNASKSADEQEKIKRDEDFNKLKEDYDALRKENSITKYSAKYRSLGFTEELANDTADAYYNGDSEKVFSNFERFKTEFEKAIRADITKNAPKPNFNGDSSNGEITKEQFAKMNYQQRVELYEKNKDLYERLNGK